MQNPRVWRPDLLLGVKGSTYSAFQALQVHQDHRKVRAWQRRANTGSPRAPSRSIRRRARPGRFNDCNILMGSEDEAAATRR
jgi:hypothetical protein